MRISDWSSDVCSSDLLGERCHEGRPPGDAGAGDIESDADVQQVEAAGDGGAAGRLLGDEPARDPQEAGPPEGEGAGLGANRVEQLGTDLQEVVEGVGRQHLGMTLQELLQSRMPKGAALGGAGTGIARSRRTQEERKEGGEGKSGSER